MTTGTVSQVLPNPLLQGSANRVWKYKWVGMNEGDSIAFLLVNEFALTNTNK